MWDLSAHAADTIFCKTCPWAIMHWKGNYTHSDPICIQNARLLLRIACTFLCNIQKIGPQRHKPFLLLSNHFLLLQQEMEYVWVILEKILLSENAYGHIRSEVCPHSHHISPSWRDEDDNQRISGFAQRPLPAANTPWLSDFQSQRRDFSI